MINMIILLLFLSVSTVLSIQGYYKLAISKPDTVSLSDTNIVAFYGTHVYVRPFSSTSFRKVNNSLQIQTTNLTNIQTDSNSLFLW